MYEDVEITVFTPTYNRSKLIVKGYESLVRQNSRNFKWLIIDDGSTDDTEEKVNEFISRANGFEIIYRKKENGGLASAYNYALDIIDTRYFVCVDSDDFLMSDAIETITEFFKKNDDANIAGLIAYNKKNNGKIIGKFPEIKTIHFSTLITKYKFKGDLKAVYKTEIAKKNYPIPIINNEKDMNPVYLMLKIDCDYKMFLLDKPICIVNYQKNGMSSNIFKHYLRSPLSFAELRRLYININDANFFFKLRHTIHFVSSSLIAKKVKQMFKEYPLKGLYVIAFIPGFILFFLIRIINKE